MVSFLILADERAVLKSHKSWAVLWLAWITLFFCDSTWRRGVHIIWKKLWFNLTCDRFLRLLHWKLLMTAWKYLYYTKLMFSIFLWFFFAKDRLPFFSFLISFQHLVLSNGRVSKSLRACSFDLTFFGFLWGATTVLLIFSGGSWLTGFSSLQSRSTSSTPAIYCSYVSIVCPLLSSLPLSFNSHQTHSFLAQMKFPGERNSIVFLHWSQ